MMVVDAIILLVMVGYVNTVSIKQVVRMIELIGVGCDDY